MYQARYTLAQSSAVRKPRVEGKPSMLPKPRRPGSIDRASTEARRSATGTYRSSSAEPARATLASNRLSREASATKLPLNRRSRSQQAEPRYGQSSMTPLRGSQYSARPTTTPVRTPSEDRLSRSWQSSVERALAFVTVKDQRPVGNVAWQRAELGRVQEALAVRAGGDGAGAALVRPLTIARFVDIAGGLLADLMRDVKLTNDNYVAKLPHLAKRFLYPAAVSKSWLKTVNTLHAFPHALAFIGYFLDLVNHLDQPVLDEWLHIEKDELACLRRDYLHKCWIRFQDPGHGFDDLNQEYLEQLRQLLGDDEHKVAQLQEVIKQLEATLEDEEEAAARASERRVRDRRDALAAALRAARQHRLQTRETAAQETARRTDQTAAIKSLDADITNVTAEIQELKRELAVQPLGVAARARLLDEVDYATRVTDSKRTLAEQLNKMILSKETELALWQKRSLDACVEYKQALIRLAATCPELAALAVDEKELMEESCALSVAGAVETLRAHAQRMAGQRTLRQQQRDDLARQRDQELEETRAQIAEAKASLAREQQALEATTAREAADAARWDADARALAETLDQLLAKEVDYSKAEAELEYWEKQDQAWRSKLAELERYIESLKEQLTLDLDTEKKKRAVLVGDVVRAWHACLDHVEREESEMEDRDREKRERDESIRTERVL